MRSDYVLLKGRPGYYVVARRGVKADYEKLETFIEFFPSVRAAYDYAIKQVEDKVSRDLEELKELNISRRRGDVYA